MRVDERHDEAQAGVERLLVLAESFEDAPLVGPDHLDGHGRVDEDEQDEDAEKDDESAMGQCSSSGDRDGVDDDAGAADLDDAHRGADGERRALDGLGPPLLAVDADQAEVAAAGDGLDDRAPARRSGAWRRCRRSARPGRGGGRWGAGRPARPATRRRRRAIRCRSGRRATARTAATTAPMAKGSRKNEPGLAISPTANTTAVPSQIHCQTFRILHVHPSLVVAATSSADGRARRHRVTGACAAGLSVASGPWPIAAC